jgi:nanoRNase/pAp phosphatase (c-di-AMP/oligoRNAs hydrolase)
MYRYSGKYNKYKLEFRSGDNGIDVSEVAKQLGGGGHFHAAGCELGSIDGVIIKDNDIQMI